MLICDTHADTLYALQDSARDTGKPLQVTMANLTEGAQDTRVQAMALWTGTEGLLGKDMGLINRAARLPKPHLASMLNCYAEILGVRVG